MQCFFNDGKDAQGTCQQCGVFACNNHASIINGKFICFSCSNNSDKLDPKKTLKEAEKIIAEDYKKLKKCSINNCSIRYYNGYGLSQSFDDYHGLSQGENAYLQALLGKVLWDTLIYQNNIKKIRNKFPITIESLKSRCPNGCLVCGEHAVKQVSSRSTLFSLYNIYQCSACKKTWEEKYYPDDSE